MTNAGMMLLVVTAVTASVEIDVRQPDRDEAWKRARVALSRCAATDVTLWYDFGSARIRARPAERTCAVEIVLETEMAEQKWACTWRLGKPWVWDLISDGKRIREAPPAQLPAELSQPCKKR
jgi:hypothetical protein